MNKLEDFITSPLGVYCHDAGSANLIVAWLQDCVIDLSVCMEGPALLIWKRYFPDINTSPIEEVLKNSTSLLSGTGWGDSEYLVRLEAKKRSIKNIAVIDHWTNYEERFSRNDNEELPDLILVSDKYASLKAKTLFPLIPIIQLPNTYLEQEVKLAKLVRTRDCRSLIENILIIAEPIRDKSSGKNQGFEFAAIEFLMNNFDKINLSNKLAKIKLRPHPSESLNKYDFIQKKYDHLVTEFTISKNSSLHDDLAWADLVVGMNSFALVVALSAKIPTMSILPPGSNESILPYEEIIHLRDL